MKQINNKRINITVMLKTFVAVFIVAVSLPALADYELSWYTIDGGGGKSSAGQYTVMGTIAQHDVAYSAGGDYELLGGFWPGEPLCTVDFYHFAGFADYWLKTGTGLPADLYEDNIIDWFDVEVFVDYWLCYCPFDWPLR